MFVPRTSGGELIARLRQAEEELSLVLGDKVKLVERTGKMLKRMLNTTNHPDNTFCSRPSCLVCSQAEEGGGGNCRARNITYQTSCLECLAKGRKSTYYGESARTAFERGQEHFTDFLSREEDSHMWKHQTTEHGDLKEVKFRMKVLKSHRSALQRQIHEAVLIELNSHENLLNSKGEYNRCKLPRLKVMFGDTEIKEHKNTEMNEKELEEEIETRKFRKREKERETERLPKSKRRRRFKVEEKVEQCRKRKVPSENEPKTNKKQKYDKKVVLEREGNKTSKDGVFPEAKCGKNSVSYHPQEGSIKVKTSKISNIIDMFNNLSKKSLENPSNCQSVFKFSANLTPKSENEKKIFPMFKLANQTREGSKLNTENKAQPSHSPLLRHHHHTPRNQQKPKTFISSKNNPKLSNIRKITHHFKVISTAQQSGPIKEQEIKINKHKLGESCDTANLEDLPENQLKRDEPQ